MASFSAPSRFSKREQDEPLPEDRRSKRSKSEHSRATFPSSPRPVYLQPSPAQMRKLFDYDNVCAHQFMGVPLRECRSLEPDEEPGEKALSKERMDDLFQEIRDIWQKCSSIFEIFHESEHPRLGYRLRVAHKLPMKLNIRENDRLTVGWKVVCPVSGPSSHLYQRSFSEEGNQYLGGPISYCNWSLQQTICVRLVNHEPWAHLIRAEIKNKVPGTELSWNYNKKIREEVFDGSAWFNPSCCRINVTSLKPIRLLQNEVWMERCVLCGLTYRSMHRDATKRNAQKKVHFIQFHSNYLGSNWDGYGTFDPAVYTVDVNCAQLEAERLNRLLTRLKKSNWSVVPACRVLNEEDLSLEKEETFHRFRQACNQLKRLGVVVLRGRGTATRYEDLRPVVCMSWSSVIPPGVKKSYAMEPDQLLKCEEELKAWEIQDSKIVLNLDPNPHNEESL